MLEGDVDLEARLAILPSSGQTKGIFFGRLVDALGPSWKSVVPSLEAPPRFGRYIPIADYPSRDYLRVLDAAARAKEAASPTREAHRRLGRSTIDEMSASSVGHALLKLIGNDLTRALMGFPATYAAGVKSIRPAHAALLEGGGVRIVFEEPVGGLEYLLGVLEGIVRFFAEEPRVDVAWGEARTTFDVRW